MLIYRDRFKHVEVYNLVPLPCLLSPSSEKLHKKAHNFNKKEERRKKNRNKFLSALHLQGLPNYSFLEMKLFLPSPFQIILQQK